jgi:hypothetical protein
MLAFPYLRHLGLCVSSLEDALVLFQQGKRALTRMLLAVHKLLARSDQYYLLNRLYVTDMCVWIQQADSQRIQNFWECAQADLGRLLALEPSDWIRFNVSILDDDEDHDLEEE